MSKRVKRKTPSYSQGADLLSKLRTPRNTYAAISIASAIYSLVLVGQAFLFLFPFMTWAAIGLYKSMDTSTLDGFKKYWVIYGGLLVVGLLSISVLTVYGVTAVTFLASVSVIAFLRRRAGRFIDNGSTIIHSYEFAYQQHLGKLNNEASIEFGGIPIGFKDACLSFLFVGGQGAGKTIQIRFILRDTLGAFTHVRAVVYDPSDEYYGFLRTAGVAPSRIIQANPSKADSCYAWDVCQDINSEELALEFAGLIFSEKNGSNELFWDEAVALVVFGVVRSFQLQQKSWDLLDLLEAIKTPNLIREAVKAHEDTAHIEAQIGTSDTASNIVATLASKATRFISIARKWRKAREKGRTFSFFQWGKSNKVILLGYDPLQEKQLSALNRCMLTVGGKIGLMKQTDGKGIPAESFYFVDELGNMGGMSIISKLITEGRKKGISVIGGFQNTETLPELSETGTPYRKAILEGFGHKAFLRIDGVTTAKWAAEHFGMLIGTRIKLVRNTNFWGFFTGGSVYEEEVREPNLTEDAFIDIPPCDYGQQIEGWFITLFRFNMAYNLKQALSAFSPAQVSTEVIDVQVIEDNPSQPQQGAEKHTKPLLAGSQFNEEEKPESSSEDDVSFYSFSEEEADDIFNDENDDWLCDESE